MLFGNVLFKDFQLGGQKPPGRHHFTGVAAEDFQNFAHAAGHLLCSLISTFPLSHQETTSTLNATKNKDSRTSLAGAGEAPVYTRKTHRLRACTPHARLCHLGLSLLFSSVDGNHETGRINFEKALFQNINIPPWAGAGCFITLRRQTHQLPMTSNQHTTRR